MFVLTPRFPFTQNYTEDLILCNAALTSKGKSWFKQNLAARSKMGDSSIIVLEFRSP